MQILERRFLLQDLHPSADSFVEEVLIGLQQTRKTIPCKFFYDELGAGLFDQICELDEYYITRTELALMSEHGQEMAEMLGPCCALIEYGSGSSTKTRLLLDHLANPAAYIPIDISRQQLIQSAADLAHTYEGLRLIPVCADYTQCFDLPPCGRNVERKAVYFPGSTIGNFHPDEAAAFLSRIAGVCGPGGGLLIGVDLKKSSETLEAAYNDSRGVTAAFNLNILVRINRELGANFDVDRFSHIAFFNEELGRIEMHLVSLTDQRVLIAGAEIAFRQGETIHTENSYKYSLAEFRKLAALGGFDVVKTWTDPQGLLSVQYLTALPPGGIDRNHVAAAL